MTKQKPKLNNVTLIAIAGNKQAQTIAALYKSMAQVDFAKVKLLTNIDISCSGIEVINVGGLKSWEQYNYFCVKELYKYFDTDFVLIQQWDSWVLDAEQWEDSFCEFDYLGAKWLDCGKPYNVGNGGFSIRSKRLQSILANDSNIITTCPEDTSICKVYGQYLMDDYDIKFADEETADKFAYELNEPLQPTFGFHAFHRQPYKPTVVIKRDGALGDVIMCENVLHYFHKKGYRVAIETQDQFYGVYSQHYFPVFNKKQLNPQLKCTEIDLNMSYEIFPQRSVLESYFEMAGIKDEPTRNARLNMFSGNNERLFNKYVLIHIDETGMEYRNQHGINWKSIVAFLEDSGYLVFQIGMRVNTPIATYLNTMSLEFMMFLVKGADLVIALDSGVAQVSVGLNVKTIIFFGSVNPLFRYSNFDRIRVVQSECPNSENKNCYHKKVDVVGSDCIYDKEMPPCSTYTSTQVINAIKSIMI